MTPTPSTTTAEAMALAVLRGDLAAARALADYLLENVNGGAIEIPPIKVLRHDHKNLRVVLRTYECLGGDCTVDALETERAVTDWLEGKQHLVLKGMHIELYELPEVAG